MSSDIDLLSKRFIPLFFNELCHTDLFKQMEQTVEDSPWHREKNVLVHTQMVVSEYMARWAKIQPPKYWSFTSVAEFTPIDEIEGFVGAVAAAFHDVGKPSCKVEKFKPERGTYFAFHGHELVSARLFENWVVENFAVLFGASDNSLIPENLWKIMWMIENHVPWDIKNSQLREYLARTSKHIGPYAFPIVLSADQLGRISDDQETKLQQATIWIIEFFELMYNLTEQLVHLDAPVLYIPIGSSGCGKSTYLHNEMESVCPELVEYSWDALRHEWYDRDDYAKAFRMSTEDKNFQQKADKAFRSIVENNSNVYVDNTNLTRKRRAFFINEARKRGYRVVALTFPVSLDTVFVRQFSRTDKTVPEEVVRRQYMSLQQPSLGEFDEIVVVDTNIK